MNKGFGLFDDGIDKDRKHFAVAIGDSFTKGVGSGDNLKNGWVELTEKKLKDIDIPIIAFVNGYALGGGFELALSSDLIIASDNAKFGLPEINLGLIPGIGGTQKTKKFTSNQNIKYLAMSGDIIDAETAMKFGIVSQIIPKENFNDFMIKFLIKISSKPKKSLQIIKKLVNLEINSKNALQKERQEFYKLLDSKNKKIGIESFILKKTPVWD